MKHILKKTYIALLTIILCVGLYAQEKSNYEILTEKIPINFNNIYPLSAVSVIPGSELISVKGRILAKSEYMISYKQGYLTLSDSLKVSVFDTLYVTYKAYETSLKKIYQRRSLIVRYDEQRHDTLRVMNMESGGLSPEAIFGKDMQKSGSIVRGFTIGTTRDFTINSGLRLQLSGKLSDNISIVAALTDENTPIQPEGNTEKLDELDKIFIEIRHPNAAGTFGDFDYKYRQGEFGAIDRKLQGLKGEFEFKDYKGNIAIAGSKGKFNTAQFNGLDGVQGPYRLTGVNNERDIIVIAGSERVYVDGREMKRGERNDYIIDYSNSEITFTPNRLITNASRIAVDYEFTDRRYARSFFGTGFVTSQLDNRLNIKINYFREGDNQDSPVDISLTDDDKKILAAAGNDRNAAVKSGITAAQPDSTGKIKGAYTKVDTTINGTPFSYYLYTPGNGLFNITFSSVGPGKGDYNRESLGNYKFAGIGAGAYLPIIYLPMPELKQMGNIAIEAIPYKDVSLNVEAAGSIYSKNRFADISNSENAGTARSIFLNVLPRQLSIFSLNLGKIGLSLKDRFIQDKFTTLDRINEVEFSRNYNIQNAGQAVSEQLREAVLNLVPVEQLNISSMYGYLKRGDLFLSKRSLTEVKFNQKDFFGGDYKLDYVKSKNELTTSDWYRQLGNLFVKYDKLRTAVDFLSESRNDILNMRDSLLVGSLKYLELTPSVELLNFSGFNLKVQYSLREDSFPLNGLMEKESKSYTQGYELSYKGIKEFSSSINFMMRKKKYTDNFRRKGFSDNETVLIRSQNRINLFQDILNGDIYYEGSTQRSARLERLFVKVPQGTGNFKYVGDLNNNGIPDENEFQPTLFDGDYMVITMPTDELFPVIDLKANTRWRVNPGKIFSKNTAANYFLSPITTETSFRVEENSRQSDIKQIYLLHFSKFQNDSTTIKGLNFFQQDLFLWENSSELSFRFRYAQTKSLTQYSGGGERGYTREKSLKIKFKMVEEIGNQTDIINLADNVIAPANSIRAREITTNSISTDFSYRPDKNIEAGFKVTIGRSEDDFPAKPTKIDQNSESFRFLLSFLSTGRLRAEIERNELIANNTQNYIPFELTKGNFIGRNYFWRLNFDYRFAGNLQSTLSYDGRLQGQGAAVHTARAEVRAFF